MLSRNWWWIACIAILAASIFLSWRFWEDLRGTQESLSTTISNMALVIGGVIAMLLAIWRSTIGERQVDAAQRQASTVQQSLLNERYQRGAEMLGGDILTVRLGGIYALASLARDYPEQYHVQIIRLFCAYARNPPVTEEKPPHPASPRADVQAVMAEIGGRSEADLRLEKMVDFRLDLRDADLRSTNLGGANLRGANMIGAKVDTANFRDADLSGAVFLGIEELRKVAPWYPSLSGAIIVCASDEKLSEEKEAARDFFQHYPDVFTALEFKTFAEWMVASKGYWWGG